MYVLQYNGIFLEPEPFSINEAGSSRENYWLYGLRYKITVKTFGDIRAVYLYSGDEIGSEANKFEFADEGNGVYTYEETAGTGATALALISDTDASFHVGVCFYMRIKIVGRNLTRTIDKKFWVKDPHDVICFGSDKIPYISPYPVLVAALAVTLAIAPTACNEAGVQKYGGIETIQAFSTPEAPSSGDHVSLLSETAVADATGITLSDRSSAGSIPDFIEPPGAPDFSRYYHYITFRLRSKRGSAYYRDINTILFGARECKADNPEYGYDSSGATLPAPSDPPTMLLIAPDGEPQGPPPICSSKTTLKTDTPLNVYAQTTTVRIYDAASGGSLIAVGAGEVVGENELEIMRVDLGGDTDQPIQGHYEIVETGPDRTTANRYETHTPGCSLVQVEIDTLTGGSETITVITTEGSRVFVPGEEYKIRFYGSKYDTTPTEIYDAVYVDGHTLTATETEDRDGWWEVVENNIVINSPREYANVEQGVTCPGSCTATAISSCLGLPLDSHGQKNGRCYWWKWMPSGTEDGYLYWVTGTIWRYKAAKKIGGIWWKYDYYDGPVDLQPNGTYTYNYSDPAGGPHCGCGPTITISDACNGYDGGAPAP